MRTAVIGSRSFTDYNLLCDELKQLPITHVVSGGARGADSLAEKWATANDIDFTRHLPNWDKHGKAAGFIRNKTIIEDCDYVVAFWDGFSKGTAHSIDIAKAVGKEVYIKLV